MTVRFLQGHSNKSVHKIEIQYFIRATAAGGRNSDGPYSNHVPNATGKSENSTPIGDYGKLQLNPRDPVGSGLAPKESAESPSRADWPPNSTSLLSRS